MMEQPDLRQIFGTYVAWRVRKGTWFINFMNGCENMYLLEGSERALLIDTGYGTGTLRAFVEGLTDKPVIVANTHFHPDHAAGNGEFEEVFLSSGAPVDYPSVEGNTPFDLNALPYPEYKKTFIGEGYVFDLGDREVEVYDVLPAHCNSSLFFYDKREKLFFCGDEFEAGQVMMFDNSNNPEAPYEVGERLDNMYRNAKRIKGMQDEIEMLLPNHNGYPISMEYIDAYMELIEHIYEGDAEIDDKLHHPFIEMDPKAPELCRVIWKDATIFIKKKEVLKVYGSGKKMD